MLLKKYSDFGGGKQTLVLSEKKYSERNKKPYPPPPLQVMVGP
jgi:hypothetical protein